MHHRKSQHRQNEREADRGYGGGHHAEVRKNYGVHNCLCPFIGHRLSI
jgi:hypothetical protein